MKLIKKIEMVKPHGAKTMRFEVMLCEVGPERYVVNYRQGLTDGSTYDGTVTPRPLSRTDAERAVERTLEQQRRTGFEQIEGSAGGASAVAPAKPVVKAPVVAAPVAAAGPATSAEVQAREVKSATQKRRDRTWELLRELRRLDARKLGGATAGSEPGRIAHRAGLLRAQKTEAQLLALQKGASPARLAAIVWALGACGGPASVSTLGALHADRKQPEMVRRAAAEALLALSDEGTRASFRATLREQLPGALRVFAPDGDAEAFQLALSEHLVTNDAGHHEVIDTLYLINDPVSRPALLGYARMAALKPSSFQRLRHLFKAAEFRRDAEMFGLLAYRFETTKPNRHDPYGAQQGTSAYGSSTRRYLRRRVWRTLLRLGSMNDPSFVPMAVGVLLPFSDGDKQTPSGYDHYNYRTRKNERIELGQYGAYYALNKLVLSRHPQMRLEPKTLLHRLHGSEPLALSPQFAPYAFAWRDRPAGLLHLLDESRCGMVHEFASAMLGSCEAFCASLDLEVILMMLARPYEPTARLGFALASRRHRSDAPDFTLLAALATCAYEPARQQAFRWMAEHAERLPQQSALLAALILAPHEDAQRQADLLLRSLRVRDANAQAVVARVIAGLLALGESDGERASRATKILSTYFAEPLSSLGAQVVADLLGHPLGAVQALGGEVLAQGTGTPPDALIERLVSSAHESVRAAGARILAKLPDVELLRHPLWIARLLASAHDDLRIEGQVLMRRLLAADAGFATPLAELLIDALLRHKLPAGAGDVILRVLQRDLGAALARLDTGRLLRLAASSNPQAQQLGGQLLLAQGQASEVSVEDLIMLSDHESAIAREAARKLLEASVPRLQADMAGAIRLLDATWDDTRTWAFQLFRTRFTEADFTLDTLIAITDSLRPDVEAFGREMLMTHFREAEGATLMLRLSEHPGAGTQLMVTDYLDRFAAGHPDRIRGLMLYFRVALGRVNKGRIAKERIYEFLRAEGIKSREVADEVVPLLHRMTATAAVRYRALALEAIVAIGHAHPTLALPVIVQTPEVRHGV